MSKNPKSLLGYCGLYCGAWGIYQGRIKQAVQNPRGVISVYGFDKMSAELTKWEPSLKHYAEFEEVMDGLVKLFGECPNCVDGGGDPTCEIRICAKEKGHTICVECAEMDACKKLSQREWTLEALKSIQPPVLRNGSRKCIRK